MPIPQSDTAVPFHTAEEAWFWFMQANQARLDGARTQSAEGRVRRPCEPVDILRILDRLYRTRRLVMDHLRVLRYYGLRMMPPEKWRHSEAKAATLWAEAMRALEPVLIAKKIMHEPFQGKVISLMRAREQHQFAGRTDMSARNTNNVTQDIWIAFTGVCDVRALKILRPGFRHCFAIIREAEHWVMVDPMLHKLDVTTTHLPHNFDLPAWLRSRGYRVVRAPHLVPRRQLSLPSPFTCVEAMKRLIGLQNWKVLTPWQLYRALLQPLHQGDTNHGKSVFQTQSA